MIMRILVSGMVMTTLALCSFADEKHAHSAPAPANAGLEKMKSLVGTWVAADKDGNPTDEVVSVIKVTAGGSAVHETIFPGQPHEMVSVYTAEGPDLAMTHYCVLGNRPAMTLKSSDGKTLSFDFDASCGINTKTEMHMHAMSLRFDDSDTITTTCKSLANGQEQESHACTLKRVKS